MNKILSIMRDGEDLTEVHGPLLIINLDFISRLHWKMMMAAQTH